MAKEAEGETSKAGIATTLDGSRHIPASVRADGSVRREIKIRPGYKPPEDVEVYKNRTAEAWKNKGKGGVPGAESVDSNTSRDSAAASKNAKRREARKRAAVEKQNDENTTSDAKLNGAGCVEQTKAEDNAVDTEVEKQKEAKKLAKKLRQARELKDKKDHGAALLPEQFEKVIRINELIRQLDALGFDIEGEKKEEDT